MPPYDELIRCVQKGKIQPEDLMEDVGISTINAVHNAAKSLNGLGERTDWIGLLERKVQQFDYGQKLERVARQLKAGENIDLSKIKIPEDDSEDYVVPATKVKRQPTPFIPCGWEAIDHHLGGVPMSGLVSVSGATNSGKTTFILKMIGEYLKNYPDLTAMLFSIEMPNWEVVMRLKEIFPKMEKSVAERILVVDRTDMDVSRIVSTAARHKPGLIAVDFADMVVQGETNTGSMEDVYRHLAKAAKDLKCPTFLLAQLSGSYQGGIPRPHYLRWTRLAEALSWMVIMTYNPSRDFYPSFDDDEQFLPAVPGKGYLVCWKVRGGFRKHDGPGAVQLPFRGDRGWHSGRGNWFSLVKMS